MALDNYAGLQAEALDWMERSGQAGKAATWIKLAEARLNRQLGVVETDASLAGTIGSRRIDISSIAMVQPIALFISANGGDERPVTPKADGTFPYRESTGSPKFWSVDGQGIDFDCPLDAAYTFRLRYRQRFGLSEDAPTNWLLDNHPDVYLAATLMWGAGYNQDWQNGAVWKQTLDEAIPEIKNHIAQSKRAIATVDAALASPGGVGRYGWDGVF